MQALEFWKTVTMDRANLLESLIQLLSEQKVKYCVIGGQAVNAYAEPLVSLDLDLVVAVDDLKRLEPIFEQRFKLDRFPHSLNISLPNSDLRVQIQTDSRYLEFPGRAVKRSVLGLTLPIAALDDLLRAKIWAASDPQRRPTKRKKDLLDIARLVEKFPDLRSKVPPELL